jgi:CHASE3 domain sensor protein
MSTFKRNLLIGYGISLLLLIVSSVASYVSIQQLVNNQKQVDRTNVVITKLDSVMSVLKDAETSQRGFLLTNIEDFLQPYNGAMGKAAVLLNQIKQLTNDNPQQQVDCRMLENVVNNRLVRLKALVNKKRNGELIPDSMLLAGKYYMDQARTLVKNMEIREQGILQQDRQKLRRFVTLTPALILIASALGIIVTIISFFRVLSDYNHRASLQQSLEKKDEQISKRLVAIEGIADQISTGDYALKVDDEGKDALGSIAGSLNKMAQSLDVTLPN